jgi:hypothetical protein
MCSPIAAAVIGSTVLAGGMASSQQSKALRAQNAAQREASAAAAKTQADAQQAEAKAQRQAPNMAALFKANKVGSAAATLLTGPGGAPLQNMALGRNVLLGG